MEGFIQFQWRPRPPSLLRDKEIKEIKKNMKSYTRDFEIKDKLSQSKASKVRCILYVYNFYPFDWAIKCNKYSRIVNSTF